MWVCWSRWTREISRGGHREAGSHPQVWWWGASGRRLDKPSSPLPCEPPHSVSGSVTLCLLPRLPSQVVLPLCGLALWAQPVRLHAQVARAEQCVRVGAACVRPLECVCSSASPAASSSCTFPPSVPPLCIPAPQGSPTPPSLDWGAAQNPFSLGAVELTCFFLLLIF